jgi:hypothetical protein
MVNQLWTICYGEYSLYCSFVEKRTAEYWKTRDINENFDILWEFISTNNYREKWGINGNLTRVHTAFILVLLKQLLLQICQNNLWNGQDIKLVNNEIDFEIVMQRNEFNLFKNLFISFFNSTFFDDLIQLYVEITREYGDRSDAQELLEEKLDFYKQKIAEYIASFEPDYIKSLLDGSRELIATTETETEEEEVLPENLPSLDRCYQIASQIMVQKANEFLILADKSTLQKLWINLNHLPDVKKGLLFFALVIPYIRLDTIHSIKNIIGANKTLNDYIETIPTLLDNAPAEYKRITSEIFKETKDLIDNIETNENNIINKLDSLNSKWGFRYGIKLFSFSTNRALDIELTTEKLRNRRRYPVYDVNALRNILNDIYDINITFINRNESINRIVTNNPHTIQNAITFNESNNLMDQNPNTFIKLKWPIGDVGFDLSEIVTMILSSGGKNEHMGLPDIPEKGQIWYSHHDLVMIFNKLDSIYRNITNHSADEDEIECNVTLIELIHQMFRDDNDTVDSLCNSLKEIEFESIFNNIPNLSTDTIRNAIDTEPLRHEALLPSLKLIQLILKQEAQQLLDLKFFLKDINLLHLIGYIGWIMLSDNASSFSEDVHDFNVTNTCKELIEKYILRYSEDNEPQEEFYYYTRNHVYNNNFNKEEFIERLRSKVGHLLNPDEATTCLHGIGGILIMLYLKTIYDLNTAISLDLIHIEELPDYISKDRIKPLSIFKYIGDGNYIYAIKHYSDTGDIVFPELYPFDYTNTNKKHDYSFQYLNIHTKTRRWCGHILISINNLLPTENLNTIDSYKLRLYGNMQYVATHDSPNSIITNFIQNNRNDICQLCCATDLFMRDRIEHFRIFTRYTIDFSNMLHDCYQNGIFNEYGHFNDANISKNTDNTDDMIHLLYENYFTEMYYDTDSEEYDEEEVTKFKTNFKEKFNKHLNVNSVVARDYSNTIIKQSQLVYFYDIIGKISNIYNDDIATGEKILFGIYQKRENEFVADILTRGLKQTNPANKWELFNNMIIAKSQMSKVLMKIIEPNYINPLYIRVDDESQLESVKKNIVTEFATYINIDNLNCNPQDTRSADNSIIFKNLSLKLIKLLIYYIFFFAIIQRYILPLTNENYPKLRYITMVKYFEELDPIEFRNLTQIFNKIINIGTNDITQEDIDTIKTLIELIIKKIYKNFYDFINMFFDEDNPATYNYHIIKLKTYKPILNRIDHIINVGSNGIANLHEHIQDIAKIYTTTPGIIFPDKTDNETEYIFNDKHFISELTDMLLKLNIIESLSAPIDGVNTILTKIVDIMEIPPIENNPEWYNILSANLNNGHNYGNLIYSPMVNEIIGGNEETHESKINKLFSSLVNGIVTIVNNPTNHHNYTILSIICLAAYHKDNIYDAPIPPPSSPRAPAEPEAEAEAEARPPLAVDAFDGLIEDEIDRDEIRELMGELNLGLE